MSCLGEHLGCDTSAAARADNDNVGLDGGGLILKWRSRELDEVKVKGGLGGLPVFRNDREACCLRVGGRLQPNDLGKRCEGLVEDARYAQPRSRPTLEDGFAIRNRPLMERRRGAC